MNQYVTSILAATLLAAVTEKLAPAGEGGRMTAHVRFLTALFLIIALLTPVKDAVAYLKGITADDVSGIVQDWVDLPEQGDYGEALGSTLTAVTAQEAEDWLQKTLAERFSIPADSCTLWVGCDSDGTAVTFSEVRIALSGASALKDPHPIEAYISEMLGCPCYVTVSN